MKKTFGGPAIFLDRADINTDEIIPAKYLTEVTKEALKPYCLEDLKLEGFDPKGEKLARSRVIVTRANFGCGSSREHAPWALLDYGFEAVISSRFADIFRNNAVKNGLLPVIVEEEVAQHLLARPDTAVRIDISERSLDIEGYGRVDFPLDPFSAYCLTRGIDQLDFILQGADDIQRYEQEHGK